MTTRLDSVSDGRYAASVTYSADIPTASGLSIEPAIPSMRSGTYAGTISVSGTPAIPSTTTSARRPRSSSPSTSPTVPSG